LSRFFGEWGREATLITIGGRSSPSQNRNVPLLLMLLLLFCCLLFCCLLSRELRCHSKWLVWPLPWARQTVKHQSSKEKSRRG
jgi:hypothetical protein